MAEPVNGNGRSKRVALVTAILGGVATLVTAIAGLVAALDAGEHAESAHKEVKVTDEANAKRDDLAFQIMRDRIEYLAQQTTATRADVSDLRSALRDYADALAAAERRQAEAEARRAVRAGRPSPRVAATPARSIAEDLLIETITEPGGEAWEGDQDPAPEPLEDPVEAGGVELPPDLAGLMEQRVQ